MLSAHLPCISSILLFLILSLSLSQYSWQKNHDQHSSSKPMWLPIIFAILLLFFISLFYINPFSFSFFPSRGKGVPPFRISIYSNFKYYSYNVCIIYCMCVSLSLYTDSWKHNMTCRHKHLFLQFDWDEIFC